MRCPECNLRNSVASRKCKSCGAQFPHKPTPRGFKIGIAALGLGIVTWGAASAIIPNLTDPEQGLERIAKRAAEGTKDAGEAKRIREEFDSSMRNYLGKVSSLSTDKMLEKLQKVLPSSSFEVHAVELPRGLKVVEVDTALQPSEYLVMKTGSTTKVFTLSGLEVFDDARIINESAGPMLVMLAHTGGNPPHKPQVRVFALLPDDIKDETERLLPAIRGEGAAKFAKNGRDILLDLSLLSLGQSEKLFAQVAQTEDGMAHQHLEWKDAHYVSRYDYGSSSFTPLYALARCMRYPDLASTHTRFLGATGQQLVRENKSPDAGDFEVKRTGSWPDRIAYRVKGNVGTFAVEVAKAAGVWSIVSAKAAAGATPTPAVATMAPVVVKPEPEQPAVKEPEKPAAKQPEKALAKQPDKKPEKVAEKKPEPKPEKKPEKKPEPPKPVVKQPEQGRNKKPVETAKKPEPPKQPDKKKPAQPEPPTETASTSTAPVQLEGDKAEIARNLLSGTVNLRNGPNTSAKPIAEMTKGAPLEVISRQNGWYKVRFQGREGYVYGGLVDYKKPDAYTTATITKSRTVHDAQHKPLGSPQAGDRLVILRGIENNKYKVQLSNGKVGYLDKDAVDVSIEAPPLVP